MSNRQNVKVHDLAGRIIADAVRKSGQPPSG
jgi:hypothetical protein